MLRRTPLLALLATAALVATPLTPIAAAAATDTISRLDFEDGTTGEWTASGSPTLVTVTDPAGENNRVLRVADRTETWHTLQSPTGLFTEGEKYTLSARVLLPESDGRARFIVKGGFDWVADTALRAGEWTTISETFAADADDSQVYVEVTPATETFYLDDVLITRASGADADGEDGDGADGDGTGTAGVVPGGAENPTTAPVSQAQATGDVAALTFDDGPNGATTTKLLDFLKQEQLPATFCVIGQNIAAPGGAELLRRMVDEGHTLCNHSTGYADMGGWDADRIRADLVENLRIIREALRDPQAKVPFFRAPNGSWGASPAVAVELGMQPLAVVNTINDWVESDPEVLTANLRTAIKPGEVVLVHDGGGDREPSLQAVTTVVSERLADGWRFTLPAGAPAPVQSGAIIEADFEDGTLQGWSPRAGSGDSAPAVTVVEGGAEGTGHAAQVSERTVEGDGIQIDVAHALLPGSTYHLEASVRFASGETAGQGLTVSMRTVTGDAESYANLTQIEDANATGWTRVAGDFTVPGYDTAAELYIEARYNSGNTSTFLVDEVRVSVPEASPVDLTLTPIKDTVDFPVGVAIDSRETTGAAADLLRHHFDQITPENHMKVEAWYGDDGAFRRHPEATSLLNFARENELRLYGHVLVWHSQTPDWFFQDDGRELSASPADKQLLRERLARHIDDVARSIADDYGLYGSDTNPIVAWDVVNEVVADQTTPDGLRTSRWHDVLGEEYIRLAFQYADEAFNTTYAAPGADRPVKLFINDYNTEQDRKGAQYEALVKRLIAADVPIDGVGHQFHVSINTTIGSLEAALNRFSGLGLMQEVTELDVTINPATETNRIRQGHFYRDVFNLLRRYHDTAPAGEKLFAATVWGLTDDRSWRSEQQPLLFGGGLQAKPAYYGAVDDADGVPALVATANVFGGDVALKDGFADAIEWRNLPGNDLTNQAGSFQTRWTPDHLTVLVRSAVAPERIEITYGDRELFWAPDAADSLDGIQTVVDGEHLVALHVPHEGISAGGSATFDLRVVSGGAVAGSWNSPGATGRLTFLEPLSLLQIPELPAPSVDGVVDPAWADAAVVGTQKLVEGSASGATAEVRSLWEGNRLYVLYEVMDPQIDTSNSDPWNRDSVELFLDLGNTKAGSYGPNDSQIRVTSEGDLSFGTGSAAAQQARVASSATAATATGYTVELAIDLVGQSGGQSDVPLGGADTFHGLDFQINDGRGGSRFAVHTWADPTGTGYQSTARWGVAHLVSADEAQGPGDGEPQGPGSDGSDDGSGNGDGGDGAVGSGGTGTNGSAAPDRAGSQGAGNALASTGATLPWGLALLAAALVAGGLLLSPLRRRRV